VGVDREWLYTQPYDTATQDEVNTLNRHQEDVSRALKSFISSSTSVPLPFLAEYVTEEEVNRLTKQFHESPDKDKMIAKASWGPRTGASFATREVGLSRLNSRGRKARIKQMTDQCTVESGVNRGKRRQVMATAVMHELKGRVAGAGGIDAMDTSTFTGICVWLP
jgi:hypothetical protein